MKLNIHLLDVEVEDDQDYAELVDALTQSVAVLGASARNVQIDDGSITGAFFKPADPLGIDK